MTEAVVVKFMMPTRPPRPRSAPVSAQLQAEDAAAGTPITPSTLPVTRVARQLALAHSIEQLVEQEGVKNLAEVARVIGVSRARVTQIVGLLGLSPQLQELILSGQLHIAERQLRRVLQTAVWDEQRALLEAMVIRRRPRATRSLGR